jgi:4-hydroxythreonine-4-phosphate dehydrogenase
MLDVAVIADDLTGAADCGIAFAEAGLATFVAFAEAPAPAGIRVLSVDTDSRREPEEEAVRRAGAAAARALADGARTLYRKIDSTLRGHVGPELAETLRAIAAARYARPIALFAPAFPGTGRTTIGGEVRVKGVPLGETEVWRDARMACPPRPSALLARAGLAVREVSLARVRGGADALRRELEVLALEATAIVLDAESEEDLAAIARAGTRLATPVVWVGSAGLARHLPAALGLAGPRAASAAPRSPREGAVLVLVGSRSSVAREQARVAGAEPGVAAVTLDPGALLAGPGDPRWPAPDLARALEGGRDVVASFGEDPLGAERGPAIAAAAGRLVAPRAAQLCGVVATGGDVARALLGALGATGLHLVGEVEPGVPLGVTDSEPPLAVITKAGAFGNPGTLSRCRAALRAARQEA